MCKGYEILQPIDIIYKGKRLNMKRTEISIDVDNSQSWLSDSQW